MTPSPPRSDARSSVQSSARPNRAAALVVSGSTRHLAPGEDYDCFCDVVAPVYVGVRPERAAGPFAADFALYDLGATGYGVLRTPPVSARRDAAAIARLSDDAFFLNLGPAGWAVEHLGRSWAVPGGMPFLLDNDRPFRIRVDPRHDLRLHSLRIPRQLLPGIDVAVVDARIRSAESGALLAAQAGLLATAVECGRLDVASAMSEAVVGLLDGLAREGGASPADRLSTAKQIARRHLADPAFGLAHLARALRCSPRTVQSDFASRGETLSTWLLGERLDRARALLCDVEWHGRTVAAVAAASGFSDVSTFHRAFRARFGCTPTSVR